MALPTDSTLPPDSLSLSGSLPGVRLATALVLLWSREEPGRAGEVLLFPRHAGSTWVFGRDGGAAGSGARVIHLARQRPGANEPTGPVVSPRISRSQLRFRVEPSGALAVENLGRCPMIHEGDEVVSAALRPGDVLELRHEMSFLCVERPLSLPAIEGAIHAFGKPDALGIIGESACIWELRRALLAVARRPVHVLVLGDSGTGKELVARAIHARSPRASRAFVARNAATFPESLLDAELFGNAKGFPNPESPERGGLIGEADRGTLFLDEIGELPESLQAHLLRVLDDGEYHRLGEARARRVDLRLVAATNRPESALKHDVLARLTARIAVPSLDARREDIPLLVHHLLRRQAASEPALAKRIFPDGDLTAAPRVAPELVHALLKHRYATNLRELDALLLAATLDGRGKYAGLTEGVRRTLSAGAGAQGGVRAPSSVVPRAAPQPSRDTGRPPAAAFTEEEERRLAFQRAHGFRAAACARDAGYGVNRQSADFHLRHLMARALSMSDYRVAAAEELLAGADPLLRERIHERMEKFLDNLRARLAETGREPLARSLADEWRGAAQVALDLLSAIETNAVG